MENASGTEFVSVPIMAIKDEPLSNDDLIEETDPPAAAEDDPMNLLDPVQVSETRNLEDNSSERSQKWPSSDLWQSWMVEFPWLLHEDEDDVYCYCLYCNIKLHIKYKNTPKAHDQGRNHLENKDNYLAFKESEESVNLGGNEVSIKQEFGTDSNISAIKFKRMSQTEPLLNFVWSRWLEAHPWLERDKDDATYGYCKYCKVRLQVEYSYQRLRHEEGNKHRTYVWQHSNRDSLSRNRSSNQREESNYEEAMEERDNEQAENTGNDDDNENNAKINKPINADVSHSKRRQAGEYLKSPWIQLHRNTPQFCSCKICNVKMMVSNFGRHLSSKTHIDTEKSYKSSKNNALKVKQENDVKTHGWGMYAKKHPWLIGDPDDPNHGYCKYCKKRLFYAKNTSKRLLHERGIAHKAAVKSFKRKLRARSAVQNSGEEEEELEHESKDKKDSNEAEESDANNEQNDEDNDDEDTDDDGGGEEAEDAEEAEEEEDEEDEGEEEEEENEEDDEEEEEDEEEEQEEASEEKKVDFRSRVLKGSDEWIRMHPWCKKYKDSDYYWCIYCKKALKLSLHRKKHEATAIHKEAEEMALSKPTNNLSHFEHSQQDKRIKYYPWLVYTKNNPKYVFCKYCRIRMVANSSRIKHEKSKRHKEAAVLFGDKLKKTPLKAPKVLPQPKPIVQVRSIQTKVAMWKSRFPWLTYKRSEKQPNYGFCKYCDMRVFCPSDKMASKHQRTSKHVRARIQIKRKDKQEQKENEEATETVAEKNNEPSESYPEWVTDLDGDYALCKYCNIRLYIKQETLRKRHQLTTKHKNAEIEYSKACNEKTSGDAAENTECDTVVLEDDILSVKSEPMDEDDVFEYLLQRSEKSRASKKLRDDVEPESTEQTRKRQKLSDPTLIDRANKFTTAHLELLRLSRGLSDKRCHKKGFSLPNSLFNTSAAIAALMSPSQAIATPPAPPPPPPQPMRNNFELFFDSVCESVKTLPTDLAAEGKIKIMQLVADLETRALQRSHSMSDLQINSTQSSTPLSSRNAYSPAVSTDMPTTTTNGFENDSTSPIAAVPLTQSASSQNLDNGLRLVPISSISNVQQRPQDIVEINSGNAHRRVQTTTSNAGDNNIKVVPINSLTHASQKQIDPSVSRISQQQSPSKKITYTKLTQSTQGGFIQITPSSSSSMNYPRSTQIQQSSTNSDNAGVQRIQQMQQPQIQQQQHQQQYQQQSQPQQSMQKTTIIDNGVRRYQITSNPTKNFNSSNELTFRRIQLPLKGGATITTKSNMTTSTPNQRNSNI